MQYTRRVPIPDAWSVPFAAGVGLLALLIGITVLSWGSISGGVDTAGVVTQVGERTQHSSTNGTKRIRVLTVRIDQPTRRFDHVDDDLVLASPTVGDTVDVRISSDGSKVSLRGLRGFTLFGIGAIIVGLGFFREAWKYRREAASPGADVEAPGTEP